MGYTIAIQECEKKSTHSFRGVVVITSALHAEDRRGSKKSVLFYTTDCGDGKEDLGLKLQQRSVSLTALHTGSGTQQQYLEPRMAQLETLEAKASVRPWVETDSDRSSRPDCRFRSQCPLLSATAVPQEQDFVLSNQKECLAMATEDIRLVAYFLQANLVGGLVWDTPGVQGLVSHPSFWSLRSQGRH
ncbi:hypothetical protein WN51_01724 [Melipona quadrifasciata]|uniref:Uncharacterized protein n=1 Tax=Melipona quadrifasciata TaxID=166423 RepID=A0A0M8ZUK0_9HYME|nr:hypothetical protein WN51_01724 [Melipona quadrifasciata]